MEMLEQLTLESIAPELLPLMRENHQQIFRYYSDDQLLVRVKNQLRYLKSHGLNTEKAIHRGLHVLVMFGENPQWAFDILNSSLDSDSKALMLTYEAISALKKQVMEKSDRVAPV